MKESPGEACLAGWLDDVGITGWKREYLFAPPRRWRFDFAWPEKMFAVEVEGLTGGKGGGHQRIMGFVADCEKHEAALVRGWFVYRVPNLWLATSRKVYKRPEVMETILNMLGE